jgi:glycosyltransferase involved in cell wall biosynthesis
LFERGNAEGLAEKMKLLWQNADLCRKMGQAGRKKAIREYSEDVYYERLMAVYDKAIKRGKES